MQRRVQAGAFRALPKWRVPTHARRHSSSFALPPVYAAAGLLYLVRLVEAYPEAAELGRRSAPGDGMPLAIVALNALYMLR